MYDDRTRLALLDIRNAATKIAKYVAGVSLDEFKADTQKHEAVEWNLFVIGEAANRLPAHVKESHPQVPWSQIKGLRNRLAHGYDSIELASIWKIATEQLDELRTTISTIIDSHFSH